MRRTAIRDISLLYASTFLILASASVSPSLTLIAQEFAATPRASFLAQWIVTLPALTGLLSAPLVGWAMDRWGRARILSASVLLYVLAGAYPVIAHSLSEILISRAILGLAISGTATGSITLISDYYTGEKLHHLMGQQGMINAFGGVLYALLGGYLGDANWRGGFALVLLGGLALPGILLFARDPEKSSTEPADDSTTKATLPLKDVGGVYVSAFLGMLLFYLIPVQISFFMAERMQAGPSQAGAVHAAMNLSSAIVAIGYGRARARVLPQHLFVFVFGLMAVGMLMLSQSHTFGAALAALLVFGLGLGWMIPNQNVWLVGLVPVTMRGRTVGGLNTARQIGQVLSPIAAAPLIAAIGLGGTLAVGAAGFGALALAFALGRTRRASGEGSAVELLDEPAD